MQLQTVSPREPDQRLPKDAVMASALHLSRGLPIAADAACGSQVAAGGAMKRKREQAVCRPYATLLPDDPEQ